MHRACRRLPPAFYSEGIFYIILILALSLVGEEIEQEDPLRQMRSRMSCALTDQTWLLVVHVALIAAGGGSLAYKRSVASWPTGAL
jgi:hypothetical protein